jgi:hypothetical protein
MGKYINEPFKGDLVKIIWLDADSESGWQPHQPDTDDNAEPLISYGLFVSKGTKFVTISHCHNVEADEWLGKHRIPISFIQSVEILQSAEET